MSFSPSYSLRYPEKTVEDYVNFRFRDSKFEMERVIGTISMIPREVETVLDIGAGYGVFLEELNKTKGIKGVGVEIAEDRIDFARSRGIAWLGEPHQNWNSLPGHLTWLLEWRF